MQKKNARDTLLKYLHRKDVTASLQRFVRPHVAADKRRGHSLVFIVVKHILPVLTRCEEIYSYISRFEHARDLITGNNESQAVEA